MASISWRKKSKFLQESKDPSWPELWYLWKGNLLLLLLLLTSCQSNSFPCCSQISQICSCLRANNLIPAVSSSLILAIKAWPHSGVSPESPVPVFGQMSFFQWILLRLFEIKIPTFFLIISPYLLLSTLNLLTYYWTVYILISFIVHLMSVE